MLAKSANGLSEEQINHWLTAQDISGFPTIDLDDGEYVIRVETLAAGVYRMLRALFASEEEAAKANETARVLLYGETPPAGDGLAPWGRRRQGRSGDRCAAKLSETN
jgi:hypothetical protein